MTAIPDGISGPILRFVVNFDDMRQEAHGIAQAALREHGIALRIIGEYRLQADWPTEFQPTRNPCIFTVTPELAWLMNVLEESAGITPAPFIVELIYPQGSGVPVGRAQLGATRSGTPAAALSGATLSYQVRDLAQANPDTVMPRLSRCRERFAAGDYGQALPEQVNANRRSRAENRGEVVGVYPANDLPGRQVIIAQRLPREKGPCLLLAGE